MRATQEILTEAKKAKPFLAMADTDRKNTALTACAAALRKHKKEILVANAEDVEHARGVI